MTLPTEYLDGLRSIVLGMTEQQWRHTGIVPTYKLMVELVAYIDELEAKNACLQFELAQYGDKNE